MSVQWYLKKADGAVYGPVALEDLKHWAIDGRVDPDDQLSDDQIHWSPAPQLAALEMDCLLRLPDGQQYGPVHRNLLREFILEGEIGPTQLVFDQQTQREEAAAIIALRADAPPPAPEVDEAAIESRLRHTLEAEWAAVQEQHAQVLQEMERRHSEHVHSLSVALETAQREQQKLVEQAATRQAEIDQLYADLDQAQRALEEAQAGDRAEEAGLATLRQELEQQRAEQARLEEALVAAQQVQAQTHAALVKEQAAREDIQTRENALADAEAEAARLQEALDQAQAQVRQLEGELDQQPPPAPAIDIAAEVAAATAQLEREFADFRAAAAKREQQLKARLKQFEDDLSATVESALRAKAEATHAARPGSGSGDAFKREALFSMREQVRYSSARAAHNPRTSAQRAALVLKYSPQPAKALPKKKRRPAP